MNSFDTFSDLTERPVALANFQYLLPAISFGFLWFFEKTTVFYLLAAASLALGIFMITYTYSARLEQMTNLAKAKKELNVIKKALQEPQRIVKHYSNMIIFASSLWFIVFALSVWETYLKSQQTEFGVLLLIQFAIMVRLFSVFALRASITNTGILAINQTRLERNRFKRN